MAAATGQLIGFTVKVLLAQNQLGELLSRRENKLGCSAQTWL